MEQIENADKVLAQLQAAGAALAAAAELAQAGGGEELPAEIRYALSLVGGAATRYLGEGIPAADALYRLAAPTPAADALYKVAAAGDTAKLVARIKALRNARRAQTGQKAAATQRKLEALCAEAKAAGIPDDRIR